MPARTLASVTSLSRRELGLRELERRAKFDSASNQPQASNEKLTDGCSLVQAWRRACCLTEVRFSRARCRRPVVQLPTLSTHTTRDKKNR